MNAIIQTKELRKNFKTEEVLKSIDFNLNEGEICALIGKNGAGKSTFFKLLSGQMIPTSGNIQLFDKKGPHLGKARKRVGFIIESPAFFPDFTGVQNLEYLRLQRGVTEKKRIHEVLEIVGLTNAKHKKFHTYSMGMKQKLVLIIGILLDYEYILMDELFAGIDFIAAEVITDFLKELKDAGKTIVVSTHQLNIAQQLADEILFLHNGHVHQMTNRFNTAHELQNYLRVLI